MNRHLTILPLVFVFATLPASAILDTNGNGLSDRWEAQYKVGVHVSANLDPAVDDDGDGWTNAQEAAAGTDPFDPSAPVGYLRPETTRVPEHWEDTNGDGIPEFVPESITQVFVGLPGKQYTLLTSTDLAEQSWIPVEDPFISVGNETTYCLYVTDLESRFWCIKIEDVDSDGDGLTDAEENELGTNPTLADSDNDGMPDGWEMANNLEPTDPADAATDADGDGLTNLLEFTHHSNPALGDTDGDTLSDGDEVHIYHTDPTLIDTDGDYLWDNEEIDLGTNPLKVDSDGDWMDDAFEAFCFVNYGYLLDPLDPADGLWDADNDTLPNQLEYVFYFEGFDLFVANDPATFQWLLDPDGDGLSTLAEFTGTPRTNPVVNLDTDGDSLPDDWERQHYLDPTKGTGVDGTDGDPDTDDLTNFQEWLYGTDPRDADSDNDGRNDGQEMTDNTDPLKQDQPYVPPTNQDTPVAQFEDVIFRVGDPSYSLSERWRMTVKGTGPDDYRTLGLASPGFGAMAQATFKLRKWNTYEITLTHVATSPEQLRDAGAADYDWEATVDALPAGQAETSTPTLGGQNNYFMVKDHWLVDNATAILTIEKHGDETNLTVGKKATLVPVDIDDNQLASGVDDLSCTVGLNTGGYQQDHWIMAPSGPVPEDPSWGDTAIFKTPLPSAPQLSITTFDATANPDHIPLSDALPLPGIVWRSTAAATVDEVPSYLIGPNPQPVALPIHVKIMKKRNLTVAVFPVHSLPGDRPVPVPSKAEIAEEFKRVFGWQINLWLRKEDITINTDIEWRYEDYVGEGEEGEKDDSGRTLDIRSDAFSQILSLSYDPEADFNLILIDRVRFKDAEGNKTGFRPPNTNSAFVVTADSENHDRPLKNICELATHEFGHALISPFHPDKGTGPAPLQGTPRNERLMNSQYIIDLSHRLVKAEWDEAEKWLRTRPNGDN